MKVAVSELKEIREIFGLTKSEMADLLGRRAQSLIEWETRGVPRDKRASVERLHDLAQLFRRRVIASRIPEIVRTPGMHGSAIAPFWKRFAPMASTRSMRISAACSTMAACE
jgi:DNA-binding XRE family transcriptional regulator